MWIWKVITKTIKNVDWWLFKGFASILRRLNHLIFQFEYERFRKWYIRHSSRYQSEADKFMLQDTILRLDPSFEMRQLQFSNYFGAFKPTFSAVFSNKTPYAFYDSYIFYKNHVLSDPFQFNQSISSYAEFYNSTMQQNSDLFYKLNQYRVTTKYKFNPLDEDYSLPYVSPGDFTQPFSTSVNAHIFAVVLILFFPVFFIVGVFHQLMLYFFFRLIKWFQFLNYFSKSCKKFGTTLSSFFIWAISRIACIVFELSYKIVSFSYTLILPLYFLFSVPFEIFKFKLKNKFRVFNVCTKYWVNRFSIRLPNRSIFVFTKSFTLFKCFKFPLLRFSTGRIYLFNFIYLFELPFRIISYPLLIFVYFFFRLTRFIIAMLIRFVRFVVFFIFVRNFGTLKFIGKVCLFFGSIVVIEYKFNLLFFLITFILRFDVFGKATPAIFSSIFMFTFMFFILAFISSKKFTYLLGRSRRRSGISFDDTGEIKAAYGRLTDAEFQKGAAIITENRQDLETLTEMDDIMGFIRNIGGGQRNYRFVAPEFLSEINNEVFRKFGQLHKLKQGEHLVDDGFDAFLLDKMSILNIVRQGTLDFFWDWDERYRAADFSITNRTYENLRLFPFTYPNHVFGPWYTFYKFSSIIVSDPRYRTYHNLLLELGSINLNQSRRMANAFYNGKFLNFFSGDFYNMLKKPAEFYFTNYSNLLFPKYARQKAFYDFDNKVYDEPKKYSFGRFFNRGDSNGLRQLYNFRLGEFTKMSILDLKKLKRRIEHMSRRSFRKFLWRLKRIKVYGKKKLGRVEKLDVVSVRAYEDVLESDPSTKYRFSSANDSMSVFGRAMRFRLLRDPDFTMSNYIDLTFAVPYALSDRMDEIADFKVADNKQYFLQFFKGYYFPNCDLTRPFVMGHFISLTSLTLAMLTLRAFTSMYRDLGDNTVDEFYEDVFGTHKMILGRMRKAITEHNMLRLLEADPEDIVFQSRDKSLTIRCALWPFEFVGRVAFLIAKTIFGSL